MNRTIAALELYWVLVTEDAIRETFEAPILALSSPNGCELLHEPDPIAHLYTVAPHMWFEFQTEAQHGHMHLLLSIIKHAKG